MQGIGSSEFDPITKLHLLSGHTSELDLRRFAIDCCRSWNGSSTDGRVLAALELVERVVAGKAGLAELREGNRLAKASLPEDDPRDEYGDTTWADLACMLTHPDALGSAECVCWIVGCKTENRPLLSALCHLFARHGDGE
jgi:hypothetical protein